MLKHILFDFDGTIADSGEIGLQILNELSEKYKIKKFTKDEMIAINSVPIKDRFKLIGIPIYKLPNIIIEVLSRYKKLVSSIKIFEGIEDVIQTLKKEGYVLSIISSNNVENIDYFLGKYNLNTFDNIISAKNIFGKNKILKSYLRDNNLNNDEILYIGDELRDIEACKKVNVKIIAVTCGFDSIELLKKSKPDYISEKPQELLEIIKNINK